VEGFGIESLATPLLDLGYTEHEDRLQFEQKKLQVTHTWHAPLIPALLLGQDRCYYGHVSCEDSQAALNSLTSGSALCSDPCSIAQAKWFVPPLAKDSNVDFPLPRIFVSEIEVEKLSDQAQLAIAKYAASSTARLGAKHGLLAAACNSLPWQVPTKEDWELLAQESEYAAWVLVNGYALNHTTLTVHRFSAEQTVLEWNEAVKAQGIALNSSGGEEKVSPDGGLRQSSTLSDKVRFRFAGGQQCEVPGPYIEFAERRVLPEFQGLPPHEVKECHRRDGFEAASADKIFESTSATQ